MRIVRTSLRSLGLTSLIQLGDGDVVIRGNENLCYVDSVNWNALRLADKTGRTDVRDNKSPAECGQCNLNISPHSISTLRYLGALGSI